MTTMDVAPELSRAKRLKAATDQVHQRLDMSIMAYDPFASRARYGLFVITQHQFHRDINALYCSSILGRLIPGLAARRLLDRVEQDLNDLGRVPPDAPDRPAFTGDDDLDIPAALGWLYVAEGSNLGAAFLLKEAEKLGLSESFGARHMASAPGGRGLHWRTFTAALDAVSLSQAEEQRAIAGATAAFARVQGLADHWLARKDA